ncbi:unnamed protein product [Caenorhabditis auriculariae]|uniref:IWS1-like protein n=1 Tax=Caenorhabditis auriculariae TaxID=2777116 RepID=A0A8S1HVK3_9PELO|nr:unnamed protein product [Caenorhabditis auriculariae]
MSVATPALVLLFFLFGVNAVGQCNLSEPPSSWLVTKGLGILDWATAGANSNGTQFCIQGDRAEKSVEVDYHVDLPDQIQKAQHHLSNKLYSNDCFNKDHRIQICIPFCWNETMQDSVVISVLNSGDATTIVRTIESDLQTNWAITAIMVDYNDPAAHLNASVFLDPTVWCSVYIGVKPKVGFPYLFEVQMANMADRGEGDWYPPQDESQDSLDGPLSPDEVIDELQNRVLTPAGEIEEQYNNDAEEMQREIASPDPEEVTSGHSTPGRTAEFTRKEHEEAEEVSAEADSADNHARAINSDEEEEDAETSSPDKKRKRARALIDSDESDGEPERRVSVASDASDGEESPEKKQNEGVVSSVFGNSDDEEEREKEGSGDEREFVEQEERPEEEPPKSNEGEDDDDDDDEIRDGGRRGNGFEWDFDVMMREKKAERKRKTKKRGDGGIDIINDDDGEVMKLVERMKAAAKADRTSNMERKPAFQKVRMLPEVKAMLLKANMTDVLVENGMMDVISEWLAPLPDKCLPALDIRLTVLKLLHNPRFWKLDRSVLKKSGLGKAVMLLYKHPSETKENKSIANKLIGEWARPIFQLDTDYSSMSREERVARDMDRMPSVKKQRLSMDQEEEVRERRGVTDSGLGPSSSGQLKPGDKGYINRARVPRPSTKDYVVRPKWNVEGEFKGERKSTGSSRYDQTFRDFAERTRKTKAARAVKVSLEGRNMAI